MGAARQRATTTKGPQALGPNDIPSLKAQEYHGKADSRDALLAAIGEAASTIDFKYPVKIRIEHDSGLMDCKAVFWIWMRHLSKEMRAKWPDAYKNLDKEGFVMHDVVCELFLGKTKAMKVGKTLLEPRTRTLTNPPLGRGDMVDLLRRIEEWSIGTLGIPLPSPPSEYSVAK